LALVAVLRFVGATAFSICWTRRGLELPLYRCQYITACVR
jgi:hypothetical protein